MPVDDLGRPASARLRGGHQRASPVLAEPLLHSPDARHRLLPAIAAGAAAVSVVQILRAVKRRRDVDLFFGAEAEDFLVKQRQVRRDHERQILAVLLIHTVSFGRDPANEREMRLAGRVRGLTSQFAEPVVVNAEMVGDLLDDGRCSTATATLRISWPSSAGSPSSAVTTIFRNGRGRPRSPAHYPT
jgi:hypothetical protein